MILKDFHAFIRIACLVLSSLIFSLPIGAFGRDEIWRNRMIQGMDSLCASSLFETTQLGLCVYDLTADSVLYEKNARQRMRPASTLKLLTAITALSTLGEAHEFRTDLYYTGQVRERVLWGDLYVRGGFDPLLEKKNLRVLLSEIQTLSIDSIAGNVYADLSFKDTLKWGKGWCWDDDNPILSPLLYEGEDCFMETFLNSLSKSGISLSPQPENISRKVPETAFYLTTCVHTMDEVLQPMMKESDNLCAEAMYYQLEENVVEKLAGWLGYTKDDFVMVDGSGLSLYNYLTPEIEIAFLRYAYQHTHVWSHLYASLPIAGKDGTLEHRMKKRFLSDRIRAKTGSVRGVSSLAGYIHAANGHVLAFCIINQGLGKLKDGRDFQDAVCELLSQ